MITSTRLNFFRVGESQYDVSQFAVNLRFGPVRRSLKFRLNPVEFFGGDEPAFFEFEPEFGPFHKPSRVIDASFRYLHTYHHRFGNRCLKLERVSFFRHSLLILPREIA